MKVSSATADLPVWRSPMISSRWPRPTGTSASSALRPVWTGSWTDLDAAPLGAFDRALAVDRVAERVDDAAEQAAAHRHVDDRAGPLDGVALADGAVVAEDHGADIVCLEVQRHALDAARELDHLAGLDVVEAVDAGNAVADRQHGADLGHLGVGAEIGDLVPDDLRDFCGTDIHVQPFKDGASAVILSLSARARRAWSGSSRRSSGCPP
jgi:hypothetical protein